MDSNFTVSVTQADIENDLEDQRDVQNKGGLILEAEVEVEPGRDDKNDDDEGEGSDEGDIVSRV